MNKVILILFLFSSNSFASKITCKLRVIEETPLQEGSSGKTLGVKTITLSENLENGQNLIEEVIDQAKFRITRFENNLVSASIIQDITLSKKQTDVYSRSTVNENNSLDVSLGLDTSDGRTIQESVNCKTIKIDAKELSTNLNNFFERL